MKIYTVLSLVLLLQRRISGLSPRMDILKHLQRNAWCKPDWCYLGMTKETNELITKCADLPTPDVTDDVDEIIKKSKAFPVPFPIESVRLEKLKVRRPVEKLRANIAYTYPIMHERVLFLFTHFLVYKRDFGSPIEKPFYRNMTVPELIDRLLKKRAVSFMGPKDQYLLLSGEEGKDGWEQIGTANQKTLTLDKCLSYDELKLSAFLYISGVTECINNGDRNNSGVVSEEDAESDAIIIGIIGPRFERDSRMDYEDILITDEQNTSDNGYGDEVTPTTCLNVLKVTYVKNNQSARHMWRQIWAEFYQVQSPTFVDLVAHNDIQETTIDKKYVDRYVKLSDHIVFDNQVYYKRICVIAETVLYEAEFRANDVGRNAFVNVIGGGLGVWKISDHQTDVYVLTFLERIRSLLKKDLLNHISDVNFAFIKPSDGILALFPNTSDSAEGPEKRIFFESKRHPKGGINVQLENRPPSSKLSGEHAGKLLVMTYAWDGNAHPGNEFWLGSLTGSGDPAAACSTQIAELHNAHINPKLTGYYTAIVSPNSRVILPQYAKTYVAGT